VNAVLAGERRLCSARFRHTEIVEAEIGRQVRLVVAGEERTGASDAAPFGESVAPPRVVFGDRMELREVERDQMGVELRHIGARGRRGGRAPPDKTSARP